MASWLGGGGGKGGGPGASRLLPPKPKKKERWLVTRKTWRYMADAGKLLIPEALRKGKDYKDYTEDDIRLLEEHYQNVCEQQREFIIWEGPVEDPRYALAKSRKAPSLSSESQDQSESHDSSDYRFESHSAKFRIVLPSGQKPPPGYVQVGTRQFPVGDIPDYQISGPESYLRLPSGLLVQELPPEILQDADWSLSGSSINSPIDSGILSPADGEYLLSPREGSPCSDDGRVPDTRESGIGSGADSIGYTNKRNISIQTDPLPSEFYHLQQGELKALEELKQKEEDERILQESEALAKREAMRKSSEDFDAAAMGDTVMRYLKMVRRNSKSVDQKKAERFRSMNYDPTLRNIKSKYVHTQQTIEAQQHIGIQCGDSLVKLLKLCETPIEPPREKPKRRKFSLTPSDSSLCSPRYSITIADDSIPHEVERDFFTHLYGGETPGLDAGNIPEEYYSYLEGWYRSQVGSHVADMKAGSAPSLQTSLLSPFSLHPVSTAMTTASSTPIVSSAGLTSPGANTVFIPVTALQSLRASLPAHLPQLTTGTIGGIGSITSSTLGISRSSASLAGHVPTTSVGASHSSNSLSFLSSVMSKGRSGSHTSKMITKKLWRQRSKSQSRATPQVVSPWAPSLDTKDSFNWTHVSGQTVALQNSTLLHLLEIERVYLQKQSQNCLANYDLGTIIRIPKDICDRTEISKTRRRANLLKKKVLSAGNIGNKLEKEKENKNKTGEGAVFGIPINQCVDPSRKRSTTDIPAEEALSPTSKSSRSDSRTSFGSIFDSPMKDKSMERIGSPLHSTGSYESLDERVMRRSSLAGGSQSMLDTLSYSSCDRLIEAGDPSERINPQPCVPSVVNTCIKYLELHGLNTVGIFRVSSSKKRVRQLREDFDSGADVILTDEVSVHDVATILKEFFRDLPEPLLPREVYHPLLAVQKIRNRKQQLDAMRRVIQLLPQVNRDTLYVLLSFLHLVAENSEDRKGPQGEDINGNKMDSNNLATLFAPNILHSMKPGDGTMSPESTAKAAERTETINIVRTLIDYNKELFELYAEDLHQLFLKMHEDVPEAMDYQLRRRAILNGDEFVDEFDSNVIYDMPEPRLIGPNDPTPLDQSQERKVSRSVSIPPILEGDTDQWEEENSLEKDTKQTRKRLRKKEEDQRGRTRRRGSEADGQEKGGSWFKFRDKSDQSDNGEQSKWFNKKREKSHSTGSAGVRSPSNESVTSPPAKGSKKDGKSGIVTGSLKINVTGLQSDKQGQGAAFHGTELDIPYIEDASDSRPSKLQTTKRVVLRRLSQDSDGKMLSCEIHLPSIKTSGTGGTDTLIYSPGSSYRGNSPSDGAFFGSGMSTPSNPLSPPPTIPTPMVFSPPPSPLAVTPTPQNRSEHDVNVSVETKYLDPGGKGAHDVSLVLKPVPQHSQRRPSPAESTKTLVNEPMPDISVSSEEKKTSPKPYALKRVKDTSLAMSSLSLPSETNGANRLSAFNPDCRSKTENLERLLTEVERSGSDHGSNTSLGGRLVKPYIRRRYTDSRHPTTELPDVRGGLSEIPSVRDPPVRKSKSKEVVSLAPEPQLDGERSPSIAERPSYKRWQMSTSKNSSESDSYV